MPIRVVLHRLLSMPVSLPVRGADGLAKRAPYGGVERQRLSSQSVKAHLRDHPVLINTARLVGEAMSVRSAHIGERRIKPALEAASMASEAALAWSGAVMALFASDKDENGDKPAKGGKAKGRKGKTSSPDDDEAAAEAAPPADERGAQVLCLGAREIAALATLARVMAANAIAPSAMRGLVTAGQAARNRQPEPVRDALAAYDALTRHCGFDGALFGRMTTGVALSRVDSAVQVGHALTVHGMQSTVDFWSAQDQLPEPGKTGAGHINTRELTTGVYYLPIVIDVDQLRTNLAALDEAGLRQVVRGLVESIATVSPAAMLGSTAPFADPGEVVVEVSSRQPINAMAAFERPVAPTLQAATAALLPHLRRMHSLVGRPSAFLTLSDFIDEDAELPAVPRFAEAVAEAAVPATVARAQAAE